MITLGNTFQSMFLVPPTGAHIMLYAIKEKKSYGYLITKVTSYISVSKIKLKINDDGTAKAIVKVNKNYVAPYQYTLYFDRAGREIKGATTREEMIYYNKERKK